MVSQFSAQALVPRVLRQYSRGTSLSVCVRSCTAGIASAALELYLIRSSNGEDAKIWEYQERRGGSGGGDEVAASPKASPGSERHYVALRGFLNPWKALCCLRSFPRPSRLLHVRSCTVVLAGAALKLNVWCHYFSIRGWRGSNRVKFLELYSIARVIFYVYPSNLENIYLTS